MVRSSGAVHRWVCLLAAVTLAMVGLALAAAPAQAAGSTRYVSTTGDDNQNDCTDSSAPCATIQNAVNQANTGDTVSIAAGTYHESVRIRTSMTLVGAGTSGANDTVIDGDGENDPSVFVDGFDTNSPPEVTIEDLDVSGNSDDDGILDDFATVHVIDCIVSHNGSNGIDVLDDSTATVAGSTVSDNDNEGIVLDFNRRDGAGRSAAKRDQVLPHATVTSSVVNGNLDGGVIVEEGQADVVGTTLDGNTGAGMVLDSGGTFGTLTTSTISNTHPFTGGREAFGGGVLTFPGGQVSIDRSTIFGNTGQGVLVWASTVTIDNSTISGTIAPEDGTQSGGPADLPYGGIAVDSVVPDRNGRALTGYGWTHASAKRNAALAARQDGPGATVTGTIDADNTTLDDCNGDVVDGGFNLDSDGSCALTADGSISKGNAKLGPLADNGGPTETLLPAKGSDAIDQIPTGTAGCSKTIPDQRGVSRPQGQSNKCDIGAVEADQPPIVIAPNKLPHGKVGHAYHAQITATGGLGAPYEFSLAPSSDPLPDGLTLHANGRISGIPSKAGRFPITVSVDDPTLKDYVIVITAPVTTPPTTPVVTPPSSGGIANTGTPVASLSMTGLLAIVGGVLLLITAGWIGARPGRHRIH